MPHSMTGFATISVVVTPFELTWEVRSVNHRFLDVSMRLPEPFRGLESRCRKQAAQRIKRGKLDCTLRVATSSSSGLSAALDSAALKEVGLLEAKVLQAFPEAGRLSVGEVLRFNGVLSEGMQKLDDAADAAIHQAFNDVLEALVAARRAEGVRIAEFLSQRVAAIDAAIDAARPLLEAAEKRYRDKLMERIERLNIASQSDRLEQELVFIAQRMDIAEELDRLSGHADEIKQILQRDEPIGRRLDFLIQELNREANTMSSKSQDEELTKISVDLKVGIEQMREQVQNLE